MKAEAPRVPAENRSPKGTGVPGNLDEQGRQGNIEQHTTHQGYQRDR